MSKEKAALPLKNMEKSSYEKPDEHALSPLIAEQEPTSIELRGVPSDTLNQSNDRTDI